MLTVWTLIICFVILIQTFNLNFIVEIIALLKKWILKIIFFKYYDQKIRDDSKHQKKLSNISINSGQLGDWRNFKNCQHNLLKEIKDKKINI